MLISQYFRFCPIDWISYGDHDRFAVGRRSIPTLLTLSLFSLLSLLTLSLFSLLSLLTLSLFSLLSLLTLYLFSLLSLLRFFCQSPFSLLFFSLSFGQSDFSGYAGFIFKSNTLRLNSLSFFFLESLSLCSHNWNHRFL